MENERIKKIFEMIEEKNISDDFIEKFWNKTLPSYKRKKRRKFLIYFSLLLFSSISIIYISQSRNIKENNFYGEDITISKIYEETLKEEYPEIYNSSVWIDNDELDELVNILKINEKEDKL
ncbi:MAG: hypothetical protein AB1410_10595 [Acidobacteriota bacterium]